MEVGEYMNEWVIVCKSCAYGKANTAARRKGLRVARLDDGALNHIREGTAGHPLHGDQHDPHVLERVRRRAGGRSRYIGYKGRHKLYAFRSPVARGTGECRPRFAHTDRDVKYEVAQD